jgi:AsmA-like C-terminal region
MTMSTTDIKMDIRIGETSFSMGAVKYLNKAVINSSVDMLADLDKMKFTLRKNYFSVNDLRLNFEGTVEMPKNDIITDLTFGTEKTSFKTLLSLVPAIYISDYKDVKATGDFTLSGSAKGVYSDADSTLPDVALNIAVNNGLISYPALPEKISNIVFNANVSINGKNPDKTIVNLDKFHMELAGSPFDMTFFLKTPMSDPDFKGTINGKIDLATLSKAVPMSGINLSGVIEMAVSMAGKLSMVEKEQYDKFSASGKIVVNNMKVAMAGYPEVEIKNAGIQFTPAFAELQRADVIIAGKSDFFITGQLRNYIPYLFKNKTIKGSLTLNSKIVDASGIMAAMSSGTTPPRSTPSTLSTSSTSSANDTTSLSAMAVPKNIDLDFNALIQKFKYDNINTENVKGHIIVRGGVLSVRDASMNMIGGTLQMSADFDTRDTLKPVMKADINMKNIDVKDAFTTFVTVQKLAPAAKGIDGKINVQLAYQSLLGKDLMPVIKTIDGSGKLQSDQITLVESATFDKLKSVLKLGDKYSNSFKDINISFKIKEGRVYVSPFNVKLGNIKMNIGGDQGLDQTLNYLIRTEIPRSDLGGAVNSLIDNLSSQAARFGISYKPADVIKINIKVGGTFTKPEVAPVLGSASGGGTNTARDNAGNEAEIQGNKSIEQAEERGQQMHDEAVVAAQKIHQQADSSGARLVNGAKGIFAKAAAQKVADVLKKEADKRGNQLIKEADDKARKLVEDAKAK